MKFDLDKGIFYSGLLGEDPRNGCFRPCAWEGKGVEKISRDTEMCEVIVLFLFKVQNG